MPPCLSVLILSRDLRFFRFSKGANHFPSAPKDFGSSLLLRYRAHRHGHDGLICDDEQSHVRLIVCRDGQAQVVSEDWA